MAALAMRGSPKSGGHSSMARLEVMSVEPCSHDGGRRACTIDEQGPISPANPSETALHVRPSARIRGFTAPPVPDSSPIFPA